MSQDLENALCDVRKAYRLLWAFQKRVLEYTNIIRERLVFDHYYTDYGFSRPSQTPHKKWSWDLLPFSNVGFVSLKHKDMKYYNDNDFSNYPLAGDMMLYIYSVPDSALDEDDCETEPNPTNFASPVECQSLFKVFLAINDIDRTERLNWLYNVARTDDDWPENKQVVSFESVEGKGIRVYGENWNLAEIPDESALLAKIDSFKNAAEEALKEGSPL